MSKISKQICDFKRLSLKQYKIILVLSPKISELVTKSKNPLKSKNELRNSQKFLKPFCSQEHPLFPKFKRIISKEKTNRFLRIQKESQKLSQ